VLGLVGVVGYVVGFVRLGVVGVVRVGVEVRVLGTVSWLTVIIPALNSIFSADGLFLAEAYPNAHVATAATIKLNFFILLFI
jgi:hypothetical protein